MNYHDSSVTMHFYTGLDLIECEAILRGTGVGTFTEEWD